MRKTQSKPTKTVKTANRKVKPVSKPRAKIVQGKVQEKKIAVRKSKRVLDLKRFEKLLVVERSRLKAKMELIEQRTARKDRLSAGEEHAHYDDHMADMASDAYEREKDLVSEDSIHNMLECVNLALQKIQNKTYGVCDNCAKDIETARLNALPFAILCLSCQTDLEG